MAAIWAIILGKIGWRGVVIAGCAIGVVIGLSAGAAWLYNEGKQNVLDKAAKQAVEDKRKALEQRQKIETDTGRLDDPALLDKLRNPDRR